MYEQMRALKHDMKSHLYTVSGLLDMGEYKKAQEYIGQIEEKTAEGDFVKTKNPIIDALLAGKGALAAERKNTSGGIGSTQSRAFDSLTVI